MNKLVIGNKNYSSWSLRPWLLLKEMGIEFTEVRIPLGEAASKSSILKLSPSGKVPVFYHGELAVWDSLAICEYIADIYPQMHCWPLSSNQRALARSISNEMHSGFQTLRTTLPMNCRAKINYGKLNLELQGDIDRICEIWRTCRMENQDKGDFLFGSFTIIDAMFAPVAIRFQGYGINIGEIEKSYMKTILSLKNLQNWMADGISEKEFLPQFEMN